MNHTRTLLLGLIAVMLIALYGIHIRSYFFASDDFAIVGLASTLSLRTIFQEPLIAFYRPLAFAFTKAQFGLFAWSAPGGYIAGSLLVHIVNAGLVYLLVRRLSEHRASAQFAGVLVLLSPWAAESYLWVSGRFDLIATCGTLGALLLGMVATQAKRWDAVLVAMLGGWLATAAAVFSKEIGAGAPVVFVATVAFALSPRRMLEPRAMAYALGMAAVVATYLHVRERLLPGLAGAYGDLQTLFSKADVLHNLWTYLKALVFLPAAEPFSSSLVSGRTLAAGVFTIVLAGGVWQVLRVRWRLAALAAVGFMAALAPVLWAWYPVGNSGNGRFLYLPGVWVAILIGTGYGIAYARALDRPSTPRSLVTIVALVLAIAYPAVSVEYQARVWRGAFATARTSIAQISPYMRAPDKLLFISNLPYFFVEGPYVLKDDAFSYYFQDAKSVSVRGRHMALKLQNGHIRFAAWVNDAKPSPEEQIVTLQVPAPIQAGVVRSESVTFDPAERRSSRLETSFGSFAISLEDVSPYADGVRVRLLVGNLSTATVEGGTLRVKWGPRRPSIESDSHATNVERWRKSLRERTLDFQEDLRSGSRNTVSLVLSGLPPAEFGYLELSMEAKTIRLAQPR